MAYVYLLNLYDEIEKKLLQIESISTQESANVSHVQGRRDILIEFKKFLTDNMNNKLPKRIRKRLENQR